jgi:hypothetical protein
LEERLKAVEGLKAVVKFILPNTEDEEVFELDFPEQSRSVWAANQQALRDVKVPNTLENSHNSLESAQMGPSDEPVEVDDDK